MGEGGGICLVGETVLLGVLGMAAYKDWKEQRVYLQMLFVAGIAGLILHLLYEEHTLVDLLGGVGVGVVILLISWGGGECIGLGDGMLLMVSGLFLGFWDNLRLLMTALLLVGGVALFLLVIKKKKRSYRVPFLPFLLAAYLFQLG